MNTLSRRSALAGAIFLALGIPVANAADLYYQPFNIGTVPPPGCNRSEFPGGPGTYPFPSDWLLFNVDNRTPNAQVAYVNNAWIVREDFSFDVTQCVAFSTSYYSPAGPADDWMWTPAIAIPAGGAMLGWRAVTYDPAYRDGYEVRVKGGAAPDVSNQTTSTVLYSTPAENASWTSYTKDLSTYAGQTVYIGFRNNSNDKFLLLIDDVRVSSIAPDLVANAPMPPFTSEYARVPEGMDVVPTLAVSALNFGGVALTNVSGIAEPLLDGATGGPAIATVAPLPSLAVGASVALTFAAPAAYSGVGTWSTKYTLSSDQSATDENPANDSIEIPGVVIGGNELARWEGAVTGSLGIGANNGGELGVALSIPTDGWYAGAHFGATAIPPATNGTPNGCPGFDYVLNLREFDTTNNMPGQIIATTQPVACAFDTDYSVDVSFVQGTQFLAAGTYVLTMAEPVGAMTVQLALHDQRFVTGSTWVTWPTIPGGGWSHFEDFGNSFAKTPQLSLLTGEAPEPPIFVDGFDGAPPARAQWHRTDKPVAPFVQRPLRKPAPTRLTEAGVR